MKTFAHLIYVHNHAYKTFLKTKISRITVYWVTTIIMIIITSTVSTDCADSTIQAQTQDQDDDIVDAHRGKTNYGFCYVLRSTHQ